MECEQEIRALCQERAYINRQIARVKDVLLFQDNETDIYKELKSVDLSSIANIPALPICNSTTSPEVNKLCEDREQAKRAAKRMFSKDDPMYYVNGSVHMTADMNWLYTYADINKRTLVCGDLI